MASPTFSIVRAINGLVGKRFAPGRASVVALVGQVDPVSIGQLFGHAKPIIAGAKQAVEGSSGGCLLPIGVSVVARVGWYFSNRHSGYPMPGPLLCK